MELITVCAWCPPREIPAGMGATHTICNKHLIENFPNQAEKVLAAQQSRVLVELANPFLVEQSF